MISPLPSPLHSAKLWLATIPLPFFGHHSCSLGIRLPCRLQDASCAGGDDGDNEVTLVVLIIPVPRPKWRDSHERNHIAATTFEGSLCVDLRLVGRHSWRWSHASMAIAA